MSKRRRQGRQLNGVLLLDKSVGISSNAALQRVKRLYQAAKAGHTGSLDPLATGMLPICFGEATKFSQFLLQADKRYQVRAQCGIKTTTADAEGEVVSRREVSGLTAQNVEAVLQQFRGDISQVPSMYSAIKHHGQPLYRLARRGIEVERKPRQVSIYALTLDAIEDSSVLLTVHCSKGTYVRNLIEDIGEALGCGAHVSALHRTQVGDLPGDAMVSYETINGLAEQSDMATLDHYLLPIDKVVCIEPTLQLSTTTAFYLQQGQPVIVPNAPADGWVKLYAAGDEFLGVGEILSDGRVAPRRLVKLK